MNEWAKWEIRKQMEAAAAALEVNGFTTILCETNEEAAEKIMELGVGAQTVGFGGSITLVELGLPEKMEEAGKQCLIHSAPGLSAEDKIEIRRRQLTCDLFLTSSNAVTLDGKLVNIDATGNRTGALTFGPKKAVVVAGSNKLVADADVGLERIRNWSAPANSKRLSMKTPCAVTGFCDDCDSPDRICRVVHVMEKCPRFSDVTVILVEQPSGL